MIFFFKLILFPVFIFFLKELFKRFALQSLEEAVASDDREKAQLHEELDQLKKELAKKEMLKKRDELEFLDLNEKVQRWLGVISEKNRFREADVLKNKSIQASIRSRQELFLRQESETKHARHQLAMFKSNMKKKFQDISMENFLHKFSTESSMDK